MPSSQQEKLPEKKKSKQGRIIHQAPQRRSYTAEYTAEDPQVE